ncbi:hypothetical protein TWF730_006095 [Orbilia blumenaviensis]|uniref:Uncharacterized protein n=1 Tax=Orbilia blumenaviensis TaxID=1796055 RepID=A0AAV9TVR1_9PEZI
MHPNLSCPTNPIPPTLLGCYYVARRIWSCKAKVKEYISSIPTRIQTRAKRVKKSIKKHSSLLKKHASDSNNGHNGRTKKWETPSPPSSIHILKRIEGGKGRPVDALELEKRLKEIEDFLKAHEKSGTRYDGCDDDSEHHQQQRAGRMRSQSGYYYSTPSQGLPVGAGAEAEEDDHFSVSTNDWTSGDGKERAEIDLFSVSTNDWNSYDEKAEEKEDVERFSVSTNDWHTCDESDEDDEDDEEDEEETEEEEEETQMTSYHFTTSPTNAYGREIEENEYRIERAQMLVFDDNEEVNMKPGCVELKNWTWYVNYGDDDLADGDRRRVGKKGDDLSGVKLYNLKRQMYETAIYDDVDIGITQFMQDL